MNKYFLLTLTVSLSNSISLAQLTRGTLMAGGGLSVSSENTKTTYDVYSLTDLRPDEEGQYIGLSLYPKIGYFIFSQWALGVTTRIDINLQSNKQTTPSGWKSEVYRKSYTLGPFLRKYFKLDKHAVFLEIQYSFGNGYFESDLSNNTGSSEEPQKNVTSISTISPAIGYTYLINRQIGIEGMLQYNAESKKLDSETSTFGYKTVSRSIRFIVYLLAYL